MGKALNGGSPGQAELYLSELAQALREGITARSRFKRVDIPKGDGRTRPLGIPAVRTASSRRR